MKPSTALNNFTLLLWKRCLKGDNVPSSGYDVHYDDRKNISVNADQRFVIEEGHHREVRSEDSPVPNIYHLLGQQIAEPNLCCIFQLLLNGSLSNSLCV
jgi:hypothetical protein